MCIKFIHSFYVSDEIFEYLAAGLPVVSTRLPTLEEFADYAYFADSAEEFASKIEKILSKSLSLNALKIKILLSQHSYRLRTKKMIATINQIMNQ